MRFSASAFVFALLACSANLVVAVPPACLLAAVNTEPNPSDLNTICGADSSKVQQQILSLCGAATQDALKAFASTCASAGKQVSIISVSASKTVSGSVHTGSSSSHNSTIIISSTFFDSSCSCTKTTVISTATVAAATFTSGSGSGSNFGSSGASATGPGPASSPTGAANKKMGSMAAAVIAVAGIAIAL